MDFYTNSTFQRGVAQGHVNQYQTFGIIITIIQAFVRRTMSAPELNPRRRQSLGEEDG